MTLQLATLQSSLRAVFQGTDSLAGYPLTAVDAGTRWAKLYADYASSAVAAPTLPTPADIAAAGGVLATALGNAFTAALGAASPYYPALVSSLVSAFAVFWPPVHFLAPGVIGVAVSPAAAQAALTTSLTSFFEAGNPTSGPGPSSDSEANSLGSILHTWTTSVVVTNTPVTGTPTTVLLT